MTRRRRFSPTAVGAAVFAVASFAIAYHVRALPGPVDGAGEISISATALTAPPTVGSLKTEAVYQLTARDPRFGGWSDLRLRGDRLLAISDQGYWMQLGPVQEGDAATTFGALRDANGAMFTSKGEADAEGLALLPDGRAAVSFEGRHRIDVYPLAEAGFEATAPTPGPALEGMAALSSNTGLEGLTTLPDGRLLAAAESGELWITPVAAGGPAAKLARVELPFGWFVTALATSEDRLYMLWRFYNPLTKEVQVQVRRCTLASVEAPPLQCERLALLAAPFPVDNFEGLAAVRTEAGDRLFVLSDDNFSRDQRTVLAVFEAPIAEKAPEPVQK